MTKNLYNGVDEGVLGFLEQLSINNTRDWIHKHKNEWTVVRKKFLEFVGETKKLLEKHDSDLIPLDVKKCLFRINRDIRFSKDKTPYKQGLSAEFSRGGKKTPYVGYYIYIQPGNHSFIGSGMYMPGPKLLKATRKHIAENFEEFEEIISNRSLQKFFEYSSHSMLKTAPRGYSVDHPAIDHLKRKGFTWLCSFTDEEVLDPSFTKNCAKKLRYLQPLVTFFNQGITNALEEGEMGLFDK